MLHVLKQGYRYHKIQKAFSKFYHRHSELIVKYNIGFKLFFKQGIAGPILYGDLVINSKELFENLILVINSKRLSKVIKRLEISWIRVGYNLDIMQQSARLF